MINEQEDRTREATSSEITREKMTFRKRAKSNRAWGTYRTNKKKYVALESQERKGLEREGYLKNSGRGLPMGKAEVKLFPFTDGIILYVVTPKDSTQNKTKQKLFRLINKSSQRAGYKINMQQSDAFLHHGSEQSKKRSKVAVPFATASNRMKYSRMNLTTEMTDPHL